MNRAQAIGWAKLGTRVRSKQGPWMVWNGRKMVLEGNGQPAVMAWTDTYESERRRP